MSDPRLPSRRGGPQARGSFRCVPCRQVVTATARGLCPRCGWAPPSLVPSSPRRADRAAALGAGYWFGVVAVSLVAGIAAAALALRLW